MAEDVGTLRGLTPPGVLPYGSILFVGKGRRIGGDGFARIDLRAMQFANFVLRTDEFYLSGETNVFKMLASPRQFKVLKCRDPFDLQRFLVSGPSGVIDGIVELRFPDVVSLRYRCNEPAWDEIFKN
jgi:hypothetical protein